MGTDRGRRVHVSAVEIRNTGLRLIVESELTVIVGLESSRQLGDALGWNEATSGSDVETVRAKPRGGAVRDAFALLVLLSRSSPAKALTLAENGREPFGEIRRLFRSIVSDRAPEQTVDLPSYRDRARRDPEAS